jgi:hypothetical protein
MKLKKGATRWVFIVFNKAFKIPSLYSYKNFLNGLLANMQEVEFSKCKDYSDKLCPVSFYLPLGLLVVMPKVRVLGEGELTIKELKSFCNTRGLTIPAEYKYNSFGYINNKLVAIDYG